MYSQGHERPDGDSCPICTLPIPLPMDKHSMFNCCCMTKICKGRVVAAVARDMTDCPFCRSPCPDKDEKLAMIQARVEKKDPVAINFLGIQYENGHLGLQKDWRKAVELYAEAAELDSIDALYSIGVAYSDGEGIEENKAKATEDYNKAAMRGHVSSRYNLGCDEVEKGNYDRAVRHWMIAAKMGHKKSIEMIKTIFAGGDATKEQYTDALKGYQDAVEEMKSHDRDEALRLGY